MIDIVKKTIPRKLKLGLKQTLRSLFESTRYWFIRDKVSRKKFCHIVFVCQGNVCRSAFAEYYLRSHLSGNSVKVESCGLDVYHAGPSPAMAMKVSGDLGVDLRTHLSKSYTACDFNNADLIVPMEYPQYFQLIKLYPEFKNKIHLLHDFLPWPERLSCNIYDPYGLGEAAFRQCFEDIRKALERLASHKSLGKKRVAA